MSGQQTEIRTQRIWIDAEGIIWAEIKARSEVQLADAEETVRAIAALSGGVRRPCLVDMTELKSMSREARVFFSGPETAKVEAAAALLIKSPLTRAIGNFFMGLNRPVIPTRLFTSTDEALAWLRGFVT